MSQLLSTSIPPSACTPHERQSCFPATDQTHFPRRSRSRAGGDSSISTAATCRSSSSAPASCHSPSRVEHRGRPGRPHRPQRGGRIPPGGQGRECDERSQIDDEGTARVRHDGIESEIPAEQLVVGDVVLIAAGDQVPADGRIVQASALQIDESALTGESTPAAKETDRCPARSWDPANRSNMAFMNTPVTHGSGTMIVTATGANTEVGKISGLLAATATEQSPLTRELNTLRLWIALPRAHHGRDVRPRSLGAGIGRFLLSAVSLAIAAIPEALPTVTQMILSLGGVELAKRNAIVKDLPSVETLGFTSAINSDKTGTLTMNQMTAVEVIDPTDRYTITGIRLRPRGHRHTPPAARDTIEDAILPYLIANDAKLVDGKVVGDPTEGALLVFAYKAGLDIDETRERLPRLATLPFDPTYKLMATFNSALDSSGSPVVRCFVKGAAPAVMGRATGALSAGKRSVDLELSGRAQSNAWKARVGRVMAAAMRDLHAPVSTRPEISFLRHRSTGDELGRYGRSSPRGVQSRGSRCSGCSYPSSNGHG